MGKYKFDLAPKVKGFVEWQLEHYHEDKRQLEQFKQDAIPSATPSYSLVGGVSGGSMGNPTEQTGLQLATNKYILMTEQTIQAIEHALDRLDTADRKLIELVYWRREYTVEGAAQMVGMDRSTAYRHINAILATLAQEIGYVSI